LLGFIVGRIMAVETARDNATAIELLRLSPDDSVLEIGFGHGRTIKAMAQQVTGGFIAGVDASPVMLRLATRANRDRISRGTVQLSLSDSQSLPYPDNRFDKLLSVHTMYFWRDPTIHFREFRRVLRSESGMVIGFRPKDQSTGSTFPAEVYNFRSTAEVCGMLTDANFSVESVTESRAGGRTVAFVTARANGQT
jgi:ubiquinone/menaquinone biosynthesis C-methylase UbiE